MGGMSRTSCRSGSFSLQSIALLAYPSSSSDMIKVLAAVLDVPSDRLIQTNRLDGRREQRQKLH
jgi:hypothetical protein